MLASCRKYGTAIGCILQISVGILGTSRAEAFTPFLVEGRNLAVSCDARVAMRGTR